jgi:N-methylhydantoinase B
VTRASALQVELARSRLSATIGELTRLLYRSAYSTLMRESRDCSITVTSPRGELLVDDPDPFHGSSYHYLIERVLDRYGDSIAAGDVFMTNHPYDAGVPHTPDLAVVVPSFVDGTLVGFCASLAHKSDVGGAVPGSASMGANHLFQEGLLLPLMRVASAESPEINAAVTDIIAANVRTPDIFFGDMRAQLGVTKVGAQRLADLATRMGIEVMDSAFEQMLEQGAETLRRVVETWPDGRVSVTGYLDHDGLNVERPVKLAVTIEKLGDSMIFDFSDSDDQTDGPVNMTPMYADAAVFYAVICSAIPDFGFSDGIRRVVTINRRLGSVVNPTMPAPVGASTMARYRLTDVCFEALSALVPDVRMAHAGSCGSVGFEWRTPGADRAFQYEVLGAAMGAMADSDGASGVTTYHTNLSVTPIEVLESKYPVRITRFELITDSGGAGEHRGGLSYRREYEALSPALVSRKAEKGRFPALGAGGGGPGRLASVSIARSGGTVEHVPVGGRYTLEPGDRLTIEGPGGGGYGDPRQRPPADVLADVRAGLVSREAAADEYGVVVTADVTIDVEATTVARAQTAGT